jgi:hypothetical protein
MRSGTGDFEYPAEAAEMASLLGLMGHASGHLNPQGDFVMEDDDEFDFDDDNEAPMGHRDEGGEATSQDAAKTIRSQQVYIEQLEDSNLKLQERIWILEQQLRTAQGDHHNVQGESDQEEEHLRGGMSPSSSDGEGAQGLGGPIARRGDDKQSRGCERDEESLQASAS